MSRVLTSVLTTLNSLGLLNQQELVYRVNGEEVTIRKNPHATEKLEQPVDQWFTSEIGDEKHPS